MTTNFLSQLQLADTNQDGSIDIEEVKSLFSTFSYFSVWWSETFCTKLIIITIMLDNREIHDQQ